MKKSQKESSSFGSFGIIVVTMGALVSLLWEFGKDCALDLWQFWLTVPHTFIGVVFLSLSWWWKWIVYCFNFINPFVEHKYRLKPVAATMELLNSEMERVQVKGNLRK